MFFSLAFKTNQFCCWCKDGFWHMTHMTRSKYGGTSKFEEEATVINTFDI